MVEKLRSRSLAVVNRDGARVYYSDNDRTLSYADNGRNVDTGVNIRHPITTSGNTVYGGCDDCHLWSWDIRCDFTERHDVLMYDMDSVLPKFDNILIIHEYVDGDEDYERITAYDLRNRGLYEIESVIGIMQGHTSHFYI